MKRLKGFATLTATALLVLGIAVLSGVVLSIQQLQLDEKHLDDAVVVKARAWKTAGTVLGTLAADWDGQQQTLDAWWNHNLSSFPGVSLVSLSGRLNLNSLSPFILSNTELAETLGGKSVEEFVTYRTNRGPFSSITDYKDYFKAEALNGLFTTYSLFSVNTADELMVEKLVGIRTGNPAFGSQVRSALRNFRMAKQPLSDANWDLLMGVEKGALDGLLGTSPELDVNTAPVELLQALFRDPDFQVPRPDDKVQILVQGRATQPWTAETLRTALSLEKKAAILPYLGTDTRFLRLDIVQGHGTLTAVVVLLMSDDVPPRLQPRVLDARWNP